VITSGHGKVHSRRKCENPDVLGRYVGCIPFIHTVIKKNVLELKTIQSITMGITLRWEKWEKDQGAHRGKRKPSIAQEGKKSFSKEKDPLPFRNGP
jgi:hypothetical protein